jgi:hypothetical protein
MQGKTRNLLFLVPALFAACVEPLDEQAIIDNRIELKKKDYINEKTKECRSRAIEQAELHVDSLIDLWVGREVMDTLLFPKRPVKPAKPAPIIGTVQKFEVGK